MTSPFKDRTGFLFVSGTVYRRIAIFRHTTPCEIFLRTLEAYRQKYNFVVHAYVIMPDHYHLLFWLPKGARLVDVLRDFKSMVGKRVIGWAQEQGLHRLLARLEMKTLRQRRKDPRYCVLQYDNYVKELAGAKILWQKIYYIHLNPVREGLVRRPEDYPYSSARAYLSGGLSLVKVSHLEGAAPRREPGG